MITSALDVTRTKILELVAKSDSRKTRKTHYQSKEYLEHLSFRDVIDLVLLYISLQPNRQQLTRVHTDAFWKLVERLWDMGNIFGEPTDQNYFPRLFAGAWHGGRDMGRSTQSSADRYASRIAGFARFEWLSSWYAFYNPELGSRMGIGELTGWRQYSRRFASEVLPKFKEPVNQKAFADILVFAEAICEDMRAMANPKPAA